VTTRNGAQARSESGQRLDDVCVGVVAEPLGDGLVDVFDLTVEVQQLAGQPLDHGADAGLPGQRELLLSGQRHRGGRGLGDTGGPGLRPQQLLADGKRQRR
jgi:hypothetical protein